MGSGSFVTMQNLTKSGLTSSTCYEGFIPKTRTSHRSFPHLRTRSLPLLSRYFLWPSSRRTNMRDPLPISIYQVLGSFPPYIDANPLCLFPESVPISLASYLVSRLRIKSTLNILTSKVTVDFILQPRLQMIHLNKKMIT